jgi:hypothetical protein
MRPPVGLNCGLSRTGSRQPSIGWVRFVISGFRLRPFRGSCSVQVVSSTSRADCKSIRPTCQATIPYRASSARVASSISASSSSLLKLSIVTSAKSSPVSSKMPISWLSIISFVTPPCGLYTASYDCTIRG